jgi:hypothetical protein
MRAALKLSPLERRDPIHRQSRHYPFRLPLTRLSNRMGPHSWRTLRQFLDEAKILTDQHPTALADFRRLQILSRRLRSATQSRRAPG